MYKDTSNVYVIDSLPLTTLSCARHHYFHRSRNHYLWKQPYIYTDNYTYQLLTQEIVFCFKFRGDIFYYLISVLLKLGKQDFDGQRLNIILNDVYV